MTLEDISILFGDPVELSFEQALSKQENRDQDLVPFQESQKAPERMEHRD